MFKQFALVLAGLVGIAFLVSFVLPGSWEVSREMQVNADPYAVHRVSGDLETWTQWSPWGRAVDGSAKVTVAPDSRAVGATYAWVGKSVGDGRLKLASSDEDTGMLFEIALRGGREPVRGRIDYTLAPNGGTNVRFTLHGDVTASPIGRYMALVRGYTMGPDVVDALTRLKRICERGV